MNASCLCNAIRKKSHKDVEYIPDFDAIAERIASVARPGDVVITQGAGSVWRVGEALLKKLEARAAAKGTGAKKSAEMPARIRGGK